MTPQLSRLNKDLMPIKPQLKVEWQVIMNKALKDQSAMNQFGGFTPEAFHFIV
jgi:hypothetical protein